MLRPVAIFPHICPTQVGMNRGLRSIFFLRLAPISTRGEMGATEPFAYQSAKIT